jgi:citrate lyase beta subunit
MRHFDQLGDAVIGELFHHPPQDFDRHSSPEVLAQALGATLYVPGSRPDLAEVIRRRVAGGVRSMVIDLEDAVHDNDLDGAVDNTVRAVHDLAGDPPGVLLFVRPRVPEQIEMLATRLGRSCGVLTGFVTPKFSPANASRYLAAARAVIDAVGSRMFVMPVLETPDLLYRETRDAALGELRAILSADRDLVLCLRLGATDLCGLYGIRRDRDLTIYHVQIVADLIGDVVNHLGRLDGTGFPISGPVWEYFEGHGRILRPRLRSSPFEQLRADKVRDRLLQADLDGLISEIVLDRSNGLTGKTVIHPSHVPVVHAMSAVSHEEFVDASDVLSSGDPPSGSAGGVRASEYRNKMNEFRPHRLWAEQIMVRAGVFGVLAGSVSMAHVLAATAAA